MRASLRNIIRRIARRWGAPGNVQWWWALFGFPSVPVVVSGGIAFLRDAPLWVMALVVASSYLLALGVGRAVLPRWLPNKPIQRPQGSIVPGASPAHGVQGGTGDEALRRRSRDLADELRQFLEDNENPDEEQTMRLYNRRLGDKASALLEELEEHSLYPPQNLKSYQLAANAKPLSPFAIRNLARTLGTIGHKQSDEAGGTPQIQRSLEELKGLCLHLAWELKDLDRWFRHTDAAVEVRVEQSSLERKRPLTEQDKAAFCKRIDELVHQHDAETVKMYHDIYKDRIMGVYGELGPRGWFGTDDRDFFQNLDDPWDIVEVGNRLERVGGKL